MKLSQRERRLLSLLALLAVVAALRLAFVVWMAPRTAPGGTAGPGRQVAAGRGAAVDEIVELRTDRLDPTSRDLTVGRDLFRYKPPPPPPPPPGPSREELDRMRLEAQQRAAAAAVPRPPEIHLRYLGSFGPDGARIAVFTDPDGNVINAHEGDVLSGAFRIERIGYESVDVSFVDFPDAPARRLPLAE